MGNNQKTVMEKKPRETNRNISPVSDENRNSVICQKYSFGGSEVTYGPGLNSAAQKCRLDL